METHESKTDDTVTEDETHEPAHQDEETTTSEDELSEDEYDEAIAGLLADLESQRTEIQQLRAELAELREQHSSHERDYEHTRKPDEPGSTIDGEPDERHWYFKRIRRD